jgi:ABC-2 type transport system permease protein
MLWMAPVALAVLALVACFIPGAVNIDGSGPAGIGAPAVGPERAVTIFVGTQMVFTTLLFALMSVVVFFYLADCLYAERKDRSILFWKSLPVSDSVTVLSKALVALVAMPVAIWALALVTNLLVFVILHVRFHDLAQHFVQWDTGAWLRLYAWLFVDILVIALWYAPIAAYQLLLSAWARSSVLVWTLLPPLALVFGERMIFKTWYVGRFLIYRLGAGLFTGPPPNFDVGPGTRGGVAESLDRMNMLPALGNVNLWIGVAVAIVLVLAAIRIRRYRDDS